MNEVAGPAPEISPARAWAPRLWFAGFALGLLLTYGINLMETPAPETVEQILTAGRLSFDRPPVPATAPYPMGRDGLFYSIHELGTVFLSLPAGVPALVVSRAAAVPFKRALEFGNAILSAALFGVLLVALLWDSPPDRAVRRRRAAVLLVLLMSSQYLVFAGFAADVSVSAVLVVLMCVAWRATARGGLVACALCGLLGSLAHYCLTRSFRVADISATQSMKFLDLVWSALLGWALFADVPTQSTLIGGAVICAATIWVARRESRGAVGGVQNGAR